LPVVVIGGGLTGIDTATESLAYYPLQVEKMVERYDTLAARFGKDNVERFFSEEERLHLTEFLTHGREVLAERRRAEAKGETPDFQPLVRKWGGVRLVYRKGMEDAPAYRLNHEEVAKALEEGITFVENMSPVEVQLDRFGAVSGIIFERQKKDADGKWHASGEMLYR
jgi:NADPH-dependent glutamate synthase beta subunit-like oxidoreductase